MDCRGMSSGGIELILPGIFGQLSGIEPLETRRESDESRLRNGDAGNRSKSKFEPSLAINSHRLLTLRHLSPTATGDLSPVTLPPLLRHYETFFIFLTSSKFPFCWSPMVTAATRASPSSRRPTTVVSLRQSQSTAAFPSGSDAELSMGRR